MPLFSGTIGTGLPGSGPLTISQLPGIAGSGTSDAGLGGAYQFAFATLNGGTTPDTLYIADNFNDGIDKYSLVSGSWVLNGEIGAFASGGATCAGAESAVPPAEPISGGEELYASLPGHIYSFFDSTGYNSPTLPSTPAPFVAVPTLTNVATASQTKAPRIEFVLQQRS